jgi:hypothetical protein
MPLTVRVDIKVDTTAPSKPIQSVSDKVSDKVPDKVSRRPAVMAHEMAQAVAKGFVPMLALPENIPLIDRVGSLYPPPWQVLFIECAINRF